MAKTLGETTEADAQLQGFRSLGAFVDAWMDKHWEWDPREVVSFDE